MQNEKQPNKAIYFDHSFAFKETNEILDKWQCSYEQKRSIMAISEDSYQSYLAEPSNVSLSDEQLDRMNYIASINRALQAAFSNVQNINGFMGMINNNPYFEGRSPLSIIGKGDILALKEVSERLDSLGRGL